ncbi:vanillin dehydrogenase, putative [Talaromyces stipitatus ATCC 10500]|uniref:Vanillin dehydrogenase, putative n=1 Tax=Talaromyces stipitatus (strain ATCC 10500 / CBS 375.48 / QM 6759 / NRRL 1006) TaxID=441959 RepID=B8MG94_TALSN|nr:vanillin dehydrogenase, putative [Talaromyces stipitatus ATCC 10500]EED16214.1 vanillin dehydrogenase, putative [Talaromyces stipitatus ATCC 10500]
MENGASVLGHVPVIPLLIDNESIVTDVKFDVVSPLNNQCCYQSSSASVAEANAAAQAAQAAFSQWTKLKPNVRRELLWKAADLMDSVSDELVRYQQEEMGALPAAARRSIKRASDLLRDAGAMISLIEGTVPSLGQEGYAAVVLKEPYGVVLGIAPWNSPFILGMRAIALPLAAGNTVILKGSELSPKCFWALGQIFYRAGLPKGCVNVIFHRPSDAIEVTNSLIAHPAVQKINFTGSTQVGRAIAAVAGKYGKPVLLELGGKAPCIILDDADLQEAASGCLIGAFAGAGQICMSTERIIVHRRVAESFRAILVEKAQEMFGASLPVPTLVSAASRKRIQILVSDALQKKAEKLFAPRDNKEQNDSQMQPIILENVSPDSDLYHTESFGPVASLFVVDSEGEAIELANDTEYGLTAAVYTNNLARGFMVAGQIQSGAVHINSPTIHDEPVLPHGGVRSSGYGRFGGVHGLDEFLQTKVITWKAD